MSGVSRVRWAAIGAALAVSLGAGGIGIVNATISSGPKAVYVPIAPCRLADTRPGPENVGSRATPIGQRDTHTFTVHGNNGKCAIPAGASAVVANVTAVAPSAQSFMTIWPADKPQPTASSLNYSAGQAPVPNAVTVALSGDGRIKVYNHNGGVHVIIDIAGYYQDHNHDDRYYTKTQTDQKIAAIPGLSGPLASPRAALTLRQGLNPNTFTTTNGWLTVVQHDVVLPVATCPAGTVARHQVSLVADGTLLGNAPVANLVMAAEMQLALDSPTSLVPGTLTEAASVSTGSTWPRVPFTTQNLFEFTGSGGTRTVYLRGRLRPNSTVSVYTVNIRVRSVHEGYTCS
jgi:hypothetical protein